eukprot:tig00000317_g24033.t1
MAISEELVKALSFEAAYIIRVEMRLSGDYKHEAKQRLHPVFEELFKSPVPTKPIPKFSTKHKRAMQAMITNYANWRADLTNDPNMHPSIAWLPLHRYTALHIAVMRGFVEWARALLEAHPDPLMAWTTLANEWTPWSPAHFAYLTNEPEIVRLAMQHAPPQLVPEQISRRPTAFSGGFFSFVSDGPVSCLRALFAPPRAPLAAVRVRLYDPASDEIRSLSVPEAEAEIAGRLGRPFRLLPGWRGTMQYLLYLLRTRLESTAADWPDLSPDQQNSLRTAVAPRLRGGPGCLEEDNLVLGWVEGVGYATFAARDVAPGEYVAHYGGRLSIRGGGNRDNDLEAQPLWLYRAELLNDCAENDTDLVECGDQLGGPAPAPVVSALSEGTLAAFVRRSDKPNARFFRYFAAGACCPVLYATRPIVRGEQVTLPLDCAERPAGPTAELAGVSGYPGILSKLLYE